MRVYFKNINDECLEQVINKISTLTLTSRSCIKKIYSSEGIFQLCDGVLQRVIIKDGVSVSETSVTNLTNLIQGQELLLDKSIITYEEEFLQIPSNHIVKTATVYTYAFANMSIIVEKQGNMINEIYFVLDTPLPLSMIKADEVGDLNVQKHTTDIVTFLSDLNLC